MSGPSLYAASCPTSTQPVSNRGRRQQTSTPSSQINNEECFKAGVQGSEEFHNVCHGTEHMARRCV